MSPRVPNGWGDPSTERHLQVPPRHATGSRAANPRVCVSITQTLVEHILSTRTPAQMQVGAFHALQDQIKAAVEANDD